MRIERYFEAPPEKVWRSWTDPEIVRRWFGSDPAGTVTGAQLDVRPGGNFAVSFVDADGTAHICSGVYATVRAGAGLSFTWRWASEPDHESFVTVRLEPAGPGTRMHFEHARLGAASQHDYTNGWQRTFDKLARVLGALRY